MSLDEQIWIYPYRMKSRSAVALAEAADIWMIRHEGSTFRGEKGKFILNWGAGTGVFNAKSGAATVLNTPQQVDLAVNKLDFFKAMTGKEAPRMPYWTTSKAQAEAWQAAGEVVIARTKLEGAKGEGLVVCKEGIDIPEAKLYTIKVRSREEYRVYMFGGEYLDARIKLLARGQEADPDGMRYSEEKYEFCPLREPLPEDVKSQARRAIRKTGLFTGGVDILWDGEKATVLEVNTAPYLGGNTAKLYAAALKKYVESQKGAKAAAGHLA